MGTNLFSTEMNFGSSLDYNEAVFHKDLRRASQLHLILRIIDYLEKGSELWVSYLTNIWTYFFTRSLKTFIYCNYLLSIADFKLKKAESVYCLN